MDGQAVHGRWLQRIFFLAALFIGAALHAQPQDTVTYVYTDPNGTPLAEADAKGNITATFEYTPYGTYAPQGTSAPGPAPKGPGYTGHVNDPETNLVYMQARYYDSASGRFLSTDPKDPTAGNLYTFSRYTYANNNPIVNIDLDGRETGIAYHSEFVAMGATPQYYISPDDKVGAPLAAAMSMLPIIGTGMAIGNAITSPSTGSIVGAGMSMLPGAGPLVADTLKGASAAERATAIAGTMSARTQRSVTIAVTETKEGIRVVSSSEKTLRPAAQAALKEGEVAAAGANKVHAEINGINAAKNMGLTPTGVAASRPICASCASQIEQHGVEPLSPLK